MSPTSEVIISVLRAVPAGSVMSYGDAAAAAGLRNGARAVVRILHACSGSHDLPWWRIVRSDGRIALSPGCGLEEQIALLRSEGVEVSDDGRVAKRKKQS